MKLLINILICFIFYTNCLTQSYVEQIVNVINNDIPSDTRFGISVFDLTKEKYLFEYNSTELLVPASTNKIIPTACALVMLGFDYELSTILSTNDLNINDGQIDGNIYLKGEGNPAFSSGSIAKMAEYLKSINIKRITGDIIVDDYLFDEILLRDHWIEDEGQNIPLPPISALTVDYNTIYITVKGNNKTKLKPVISISGENEYFRIINNARTSGRKNRIRLTSEETTNLEKITISGTIPVNRAYSFRVLVKNPAKFAGNILKKYILENDIIFKGKINKTKSPKYLKELIRSQTPLINIINSINKKSNNFYAEHLFKIIGGKYAGEEGAAFDATQSIFTFLKSNDLFEKGFSIVDGSGLSRSNKVSTRALTKILAYIYYSKDEFYPFYNSLGIAGVDGTLSGRFKGTRAENNCRGKTGTLRDVSSLAGYITTKSGNLLTFSINFNFSRLGGDYYKSIIDKIVIILADID